MWEIEAGHSGTKYSVTSRERDEQGVYTEQVALVQAQDNARLIAAAPALLAALELCQRELRGLSFKTDGITQALTAAREALDKANGGDAAEIF